MDAPPVQYVRTSDGFDIAYCVAGQGQPLAFWASGFSSIQTTWRLFPAWMSGLADRFRLICIDPRGTGLSQRALGNDFGFQSYERDVEAIAERFSEEPLVFFASGAYGHPAVRFAVRYPERVRAIVWVAPFISGTKSSLVTFGAISREVWWMTLDSMAGHYAATGAERRRLAEEFARNFDLDDLKIAVRAGVASNVEHELSSLTTPLLVLRSRDWLTNPYEWSSEVAARAANARLVVIDGADLYGDPVQGIAAIEAFLAPLPRRGMGPSPHNLDYDLSSRELEVLRLLAAGRSNQQIADELVISRNTVRRHVSNIFDKTGAANRTQAATHARDKGLA